LWDKKVLVDKDLGFAHLTLWISNELSTLRWLGFFSWSSEKDGFHEFRFCFQVSSREFFASVLGFSVFQRV
jgi:hypothetical protein